MMERPVVTIGTACPEDGLAMALLKYQNLMHRVERGELELSREETEKEYVTRESVAALATILERADADDYYLVARESGTVIGFCRMTWRPGEQRFQFRQFYVKSEYKGRKIGSAIMAAAKDSAQHSARSSKGMFLFTRDYNKSAQCMYSHWGFRHAGSGTSPLEEDVDGTAEWIKMELNF